MSRVTDLIEELSSEMLSESNENRTTDPEHAEACEEVASELLSLANHSRGV